MLVQIALFGVKVLHALDQADGQVLVHIVVVQMGGPHQSSVPLNDLADPVQVFLHDTVAFSDRIVVFHNVILSVFGGSRSGNSPGPSLS